MKRYVPMDKQSKKARKAEYARQRGTWAGVSPITRIVPNRRGYDRNRLKREDRRTLQD